MAADATGARGWLHGLVERLAERDAGADDDRLSPRSLSRLTVRVGVLLTVYVLLEQWLMWVSRLPPSAYEGESITVGLLLHLDGIEAVVTVVLLLGFVSFRPLWRSWSTMERGSLLRWFILINAGLMAWTFSTYDVNLYFDRPHGLDRLLLVGLTGLIWWRPVFVAPFLLVLLPIARQFDLPIGAFSLSHQLLPIRLLVLSVAVLVVQALTGSRKSTDFAYCALVFVASAYVSSGLAKAWTGWIHHGHIFCLLFATHANGWLPFMEAQEVTRLAKVVSLFDWPMRVVTLLIECGALFFLWRRTGLLFLLASWIAFHAAVFGLSGIFFWNWIIIDGALFAFFLMHREGHDLPVFTRPRFVLSVALIGTSIIWFRPPTLFWFDVPLTYTYHFEATTEEGARKRLPPRFFAPYDYQFTLGNFAHLVDDAHLGVVWGSVSRRDVAQGLVAAGSPEAVWRVEREKGRNRYTARRAEKFDRFIRRFVVGFNRRGKQTWLWWLQPPRQLWTFPAEIPFRGGERIRKVTVIQATSFFDGERYSEIRRRVVREIEIP